MMTTNTTDRTALARLENHLRNSDVPQHVIEAFYHLKSLIGNLSYAEEKSREAWQSAENERDMLKGQIAALAEELSHYVGRGAGV